MAYRNNMKLGWMGPNYLPPADITDDVEKLLWQMRRAKELGCVVLQPVIRGVPEDDASVERLKEGLLENGIEYEMGCPLAVFNLAGPDAKAAREELIARIKFVQKLGVKILRTGYNTVLKYEYSRYNTTPGMTGREQLERVIASLKQAAPIFEEYGMFFAQENHLDFTGEDMAHIFEEVNSPNMGIALDTANNFGVFRDPDADNLLMAPWAITTHIKDAKIVQKTQEGRYYPLIPVGTVLGEGIIDIPGIVDALATQVRYPEGFHMILEQGFWGNQITGDAYAFEHEAMEKSLEYLKKLITVN